MKTWINLTMVPLLDNYRTDPWTTRNKISKGRSVPLKGYKLNSDSLRQTYHYEKAWCAKLYHYSAAINKTIPTFNIT